MLRTSARANLPRSLSSVVMRTLVANITHASRSTSEVQRVGVCCARSDTNVDTNDSVGQINFVSFRNDVARISAPDTRLCLPRFASEASEIILTILHTSEQNDARGEMTHRFVAQYEYPLRSWTPRERGASSVSSSCGPREEFRWRP